VAHKGLFLIFQYEVVLRIIFCCKVTTFFVILQENRRKNKKGDVPVP
jgi:hypothetical protein